MMGLDDRLFYFIIGCLVGFLFGYLVKHLRTIEAKVDHVDKIIKQDHEDGFFRIPSRADLRAGWARFRGLPWKNIALAFVVLMTVYASFSTQKTNNDVKAAQAETQRVSDNQVQVGFCNSDFLSKTIVALNERTTFSKDQALANINLQRSFQVFLRVLTFKPPKPADEQEEAFFVYFDALNKFIELNDKTVGKQDKFPYPTLLQYQACLDKPFSAIEKDPDYVK